MKKIQTVTLNPAFDLHYILDRFESGKENYAKYRVSHAGGKGINTSRALTAVGIENTAYVVLGEENGKEFAKALEADGMNYQAIWVPGRVRENITVHPARFSETRISSDDFVLPISALRELEQKLFSEGVSDSLISFSGRLPKGIEKSEIIAFLKRLKNAGATLVVDSNSFCFADFLEICPDLIKPNEAEIESFYGKTIGSQEEACDVAKRLVQQGVAREVMVSLGGNGAVWSDGRHNCILQIPRLEHPVSTIGAGDSTVAGYLAACAKGLPKESALILAVSFGTAACMTEGTLPPKREDIDAVAKQVKILK